MNRVKNNHQVEMTRLNIKVPKWVAEVLMEQARVKGYPTREAYLRELLQKVAHDTYELESIQYLDQVMKPLNETFEHFIPLFYQLREAVFYKLDEFERKEYEEWLRETFGEDAEFMVRKNKELKQGFRMNLSDIRGFNDE